MCICISLNRIELIKDRYFYSVYVEEAFCVSHLCSFPSILEKETSSGLKPYNNSSSVRDFLLLNFLLLKLHIDFASVNFKWNVSWERLKENQLSKKTIIKSLSIYFVGYGLIRWGENGRLTSNINAAIWRSSWTIKLLENWHFSQ